MLCDWIWRDLLCHYILSRILPILYMVITPHTTVELNVETSLNSTLKICSVYNGYNHYSSSELNMSYHADDEYETEGNVSTIDAKDDMLNLTPIDE